MFFIVNKTKGPVVIADIGVTLGPRQAIDLDKIMPRSKSNESKMLKVANKNGTIDIRIKDGGKPSNIDPEPKSRNELDDFKSEMIEEMKNLLSKQKQPITKGGIDKSDLAEFAKQIIANMPKSETVIIREEGKEVRTDEEVEVDESLLAEINARTVDGITKNAKLGNINLKEEKQENTILDNISELEDLIG